MAHSSGVISRLPLTLLLAALLDKPPVLLGDAVAGKNREGNQLFSEGRYADAEKAYVEALAKVPGRPELLYNHGNSLLMQKKLELALQQLRQVTSKGRQGLQASAWYNSGNALFELGKFEEAAQAYIQALRINPADRDAKHNLELALKKMQQQIQPQQGRPQSDERGAKRQPQDQAKNRDGRNDMAKDESARRKESADKAATPQDGQDGSLTRNQALQILEAIQNQELADQKMQLERLKKRPSAGKDW
ncbi:MAG: tetratricopeptide repeat protein [Acidobacteria bacterium]|nr:tetratricopeptide repeat protein [Acidobacteriota bacterium]